MDRIESGKPIQLTLPEASTVIVIPKGSGPRKDSQREKIPSERWRIERYIPVSAIRKAVQELLELGQDAEQSRGNAELTQVLIMARRNNISFDDFKKFLDQNLRRMGDQIGFHKLGLDESKEVILGTAMEVWTVPDEELAKLSRAQKAPYPQKQQ